MTSIKPRILVISRSYPIYGGMEVWLEDLVCGLESQGYQIAVHLVQGEKYHIPTKYQQVHGGYPYSGIVDGRWENRRSKVRKLARLISRSGADVVIPVLVRDCLQALDALTGDLPAVFYPIHEYSPSVAKDVAEFGHLFRGVVCCDRLSSLVIARMTGYPANNIHVIPHGVGPAVCKRRTGGRFRIGFVGRICDGAKQVFQLPEVCRVLSEQGVDYQLDICGTGEDREELERRLRPFCDAGRVNYHGWVTRSQLREDIYPNLDSLILLSPKETGPMVVWEAMMHGVVPVVSEFRGLYAGRTLYHRHNAMIFPVGDTDTAAESLAQIYRDTKLYEELSRRASATVEVSKSLHRMIQDWEIALLDADVIPARDRNIVIDETRLPPAQGTLDRLVFPAFLRRAIRRLRFSNLNTSSQSEWPFFSFVDGPYAERYYALLEELDIPGEPMP